MHVLRILCSFGRFRNRGGDAGGGNLQGEREFLGDFAAKLLREAFGGSFGAVLGEGVDAEILLEAAFGGSRL